MILLTILILLVSYWLWRSTRKPPGFPPGPPRWPIVGGLLHMSSGEGKASPMFHGARRAVEEYGSIFGFYLGWQPVVMVADLEAMKELFRKEEVTSRPPTRPVSEIRAGFHLEEHEGRSPGLLLSAGRHWRDQRRFVLRNLRDFGFGKASMEGCLQAEVEKLCVAYQEKVGKKIALNDGSLSITIINALWTILVGDSFELDDPKLLRVAHIMEEAIKKSTSTLLLSFVLPHPSMVKLPGLRKVSGYETSKAYLQAINGLTAPYIKDHLQSFQPDNLRDLMDCIIAENHSTTDKDSPFFGHKIESVLSNVLLDLFLAGMETTNSSLLWSFLYMVHHPDIQKRVHQELDRVCGRDRFPSFSDQPDLHFTNAVILESLRITGLVYNALSHYTTQEIEINGFKIPKSTTVIGCHYLIMNDPKLFADPTVFKPDRFISEKSGKFVPDERVVAFGTGKRVCLGQSLAEKEYFLFFAGIMQRFEMSAAPDVELPGYGANVTQPKGVVRLPPTFQVVLKSRV